MQYQKIRGMFLGIALGDSLGMPVESWSSARIKEVYGRVEELKTPEFHKWFANQAAGTITDDTQLSLAVTEAIIESGLNMDSQAKWHVAALKDTDAGWGRSTRESIRRLANGAHWSQSGTGGDGTGTGNGVAMKIAPLGAYASIKQAELKEIIEFCNVLNAMTHRTSLSASGALAQLFAVKYCFDCKVPSSFNPDVFAKIVLAASALGRQVFPETLSDDITNRFEVLFKNLSEFDTQKLIEDFGCGSCYCYNSLPFTHGFFLKSPHRLDCLLEVINAGGDTDSNGSMVGALLGALHGDSIFPSHWVDGLVDKNSILDTADRFARFLEIQQS